MRKQKRKVQVVHDDEQQEKKEQTAQQNKKSGNSAKGKYKLRGRGTISKTPTMRPLQKTTLA